MSIRTCLFSLLALPLSFDALAQPAAIDKQKLFGYFQEQQFEEAIQYLQPAIGSDSSNAEALRLLSYAYYMNEDVPQAQQGFLKLVNIDSLNLTANAYLASLYQNRNADKAIFFLRRLTRMQPNTAHYHRTLGELLSRTIEKAEAFQLLQKAFQLAPHDYKNRVSLAELLIDLKKHPQADSLLDEGLLADSLNAAMLKTRVRSAYDTKDYPAVVLAGEKLVRIMELSTGALTKVALAYYNMQQYQNCVRVCEHMLTLGMEIEAVYYYEAKSFARLKEYAKSNQLLQICLDKALSKNAEMYYFGLAENFEAIKQYKKAIAAYDTAYYLFKTPLALYNGGRIAEVALKNETLAGKYYRRYLAIARPEDPEEKKAYNWVKKKWGKK